MKSITVHTLSHEATADRPVEGLSDVWGRVLPLMQHWVEFNRSEELVRKQQHQTLHFARMLMPAVFGEGADACVSSLYFQHRFFYYFKAQEEYFWVTSLLSRGYALSTLYFPRRHLAVSLYEHNNPPEVLEAFEAMRARIGRDLAREEADRKPIAVTGFHHFAHVLWNELPALEAVASEEQKPRIAVTHEPFGPTKELFPELSDNIQMLSNAHLDEFNRTEKLMVGLGSWTVTRGVQLRVRNVALRYVQASRLVARDAFKAKHSPILWLSVKPPQRTAVEQTSVLARLIEGIRNVYPHAGFLLNGASMPWDIDKNPNYDGYREEIKRGAKLSGALIEEVLTQLDPSLRSFVQQLNDISLCEEVAWGQIADFYFCHGGTMQHKVGWIHNIPGVTHSNSRFLTSFQGGVVEDGAPQYHLPDGLIVDDTRSVYTPDEIARKDFNYSFKSVDAVIEAVINHFKISHAA